MKKKVYCKDCVHFRELELTDDCYATREEGKWYEDYVMGGKIRGRDTGIISCYDRNKNGKCKYFEAKK